jgi:hypothetical protein
MHKGGGVDSILEYAREIAGYLLSWSGWWVWALSALAVIAWLYVRPHPFWLTDLIYRFPVVGKLTRYSTDFTERTPGGWRNVELTLCHDYAAHTSSISQREFDDHIAYLRKAHDLGRRPLPFFGLLLVTLLVFFEGLAFAYILGSWISIDSTENERTLFMLATTAVLAALLVWLTHAAGRQLYRRKVLQACFRAWKEKLGPHFFTGVISHSENEHADDSEPTYVQCANRVADHRNDFGSYTLVVLASLFIAIIAVGATLLRLSTLDSSNDADLLANIFGELGAAAAASEGQPDRLAAYVSFGILGVIFIVTQFVAMTFGYRYGFAGRESAAAYSETGGHSSYRTYWRGIKSRMNIANTRLQTLQRRIEKNSEPITWQKNFLSFVREEIEGGNSDLHLPPPSPDQPPPTTEPASVQSEQPDAADNVTPIDRSAG